jgi:hypothetical protein
MLIAERKATTTPVEVGESRDKYGPSDWAALAAVLVTVGLVCWGQSAMKLFWYDELVTFYVAKMRTVGEIVRFYETGKDTTSF